MTITARYDGICGSCGGAIRAGQSVEWSRGSRARHTDCGGQGQSVARASTPAPARGANRRGGACIDCGTYVPAGAGRIERCLGSSDGRGGGLAHYDCESRDGGDGAWHAACRDSATCAARLDARIEATRVRRTLRADLAPLAAALGAIGTGIAEHLHRTAREALTAGLVSVWRAPTDVADGPVLYERRDGDHYTEIRARAGGGLVELSGGYDDHRAHAWIPADEALARAAADPRDAAAVGEWLSLYDGCEGSTEARAVAWALGLAGQSMIVSA